MSPKPAKRYENKRLALPGYRAWLGMKTRCYNKNTPDYQNYGGRGISVCDRWRHSYENFWEDMGPSYVKGLQLDRINNDGNYEPGNVRWATVKQSVRNRRVTSKVVFQGEEIPLAEAAERIGLRVETLRVRFYRRTPLDEVFSPGTLAKPDKAGVLGGVSQDALASELGVSRRLIHNWVRKNFSVPQMREMAREIHNRRRECVSRGADGKSLTAFSKSIGVYRRTVRKWLDSGLSVEQVKELAKLPLKLRPTTQPAAPQTGKYAPMLGGVSAPKFSKELGVSNVTVINWARRGFSVEQMRDRAAAIRLRRAAKNAG